MPILPCAARARRLGTTSLRKFCSPLTSRCALRQTMSSSSEDSKLGSAVSESATGFDLAYTFPYVQVAAVVNKLKLYQTGVSSVAVPLSYTFHTAGVIPLDTAWPIAAISVAAAAALHAAGVVCTGVIGRVWVSRDAHEPQVRVSSVGFWGGRAELRLPASDLLPLAELPDAPIAPYVLLRRYSQPAPRLKLCLRWGTVANGNAFRRALGHAPF